MSILVGAVTRDRRTTRRRSAFAGVGQEPSEAAGECRRRVDMTSQIVTDEREQRPLVTGARQLVEVKLKPSQLVVDGVNELDLTREIHTGIVPLWVWV